jgi:prepilin-type N-terminal cleavage/methylation domain-containing protein
MRDKKIRGNFGFTLVEILVTMVICLVILAGVQSLLVAQIRISSLQENQASMTQEMRGAISRMTAEIHRAGIRKNSPAVPFNGILIATDKSVRLRSDLNMDGAFSGSGEDIYYQYDPSSLVVQKNGQTFLSNVIDFGLLYTLSDGSTTPAPADLSDIRKVGLRIGIRTQNPYNYGVFRTMTFSSDIQLRNNS